MTNGILIPDVRMVYWYIPKCACTSLKTAVARHLGMQVPRAWKKVHGLPFQYISHAEYHRYNGWKHFTVVRHPMRRLLSLYNNKIFRDARTIGRVKDGVTQPIFSRYGTLFRAEMSFGEFVQAIAQVIDNHPDPHFKRMTEQLPAGVKWMKAENMPTVATYLRENGIFEPLPHLNKTTGEDWQASYTPALAKVVEKTYFEDYKRFLYDNPLA